jgi:hypothetical protein
MNAGRHDTSPCIIYARPVMKLMCLLGLDGKNNSLARHPCTYLQGFPFLRTRCGSHTLRRLPGRPLRGYSPPQDLPRDSSGPARLCAMRPLIAPSGGGSGWRTSERAGCCPLRRGHPTRYRCTWPLAMYLSKILPKIPATAA